MNNDSNNHLIYNFEQEGLNTFNRITIAGLPQNLALHAANEAFLELERLEKLLSRFKAGSDIWQINNAPPGKQIPLAPETWECLQLASQIAKLTNGAFDITYGYLYDIWKTLPHPSAEDCRQARHNCHFQQLQVDPVNAVATRLNNRISIDLGGIGKGYIADKMAEILEDWEISSVLINSGGSTILALDPPPEREGWTITCGGREFSIHQTAVSASGMAKQPCHIVDHRTGIPINHEIKAWALAPTAAIADALSTAAMLMTPVEIEKLAQDCPEIKIYQTTQPQ